MSKPEPMRLRPSARLQRYLGKELISDPDLAILEFVKNAYDAGATTVVLDFAIADEPWSLTISDDGLGMDEDSFRENWLRPGFSAKSPDYDGDSSRLSPESAAASRSRQRIASGEKGLGRLASGRLGDVLEIWTRPRIQDEWLHVVFDWESFEDMNKYMDEIQVPFEWSAPREHLFETGTVIRIGGLRQSWAGRVPGRPTPGRPRTRLGRLRQDLELLIRPLSVANADFSIELRSDAYSDIADVGVIVSDDAAGTADYVLSFAINEDYAGYVTVDRVVTRSEDVTSEFPNLEARTEYETLTINRKLATSEDRSISLECGPFRGTFYYTPPPKARRARTISATGVLLYRDGILVEPYGLPGDDWIGAEARKASRQGHAAIQPSTFSGFVSITREQNSALEEMSNRLGLLDNEASDDLFSHVRAEFRFFENLLYHEVVLPRWELNAKSKAKNAAAKAEELARLRTKSLVHSVGQPLAAMGNESLRLSVVAGRPELPPDLVRELSSIQSNFDAHLERISRTIRKFADFKVPEFQRIQIEWVVEQAIAEAKELAELRDVSVTLGDSIDVTCVVAPELAAESLHELIVNAIEADRPPGVNAWVDIRLYTEGRYVVVELSDNGTGFVGGVPSDLSLVQSTRGRIAEGLVTAANAFTLMGGSLDVATSGSEGSVLLVSVPINVSN